MMNYPCAAPLVVNSVILRSQMLLNLVGYLCIQINLFFFFIGAYYTQRALCALKGSSQNNFTSSAESGKKERKKQIRNAHSHSPLTKSLLSFRRQNSNGSFKVIPSNKLFKMLNFYLTHLPIPCFSKCAPSGLFRGGYILKPR